jgi:uncharacterized membrane protein YhaH (DUF805 family)
MTSTKLLVDCITKKYFQLKGRASRKEFLLLFICKGLLEFALYISSFVLKAKTFWLAIVISPILVFLYIPSFTVIIRRLHDMNCSGWWLLLFLVTFFVIFMTTFILQINTSEVYIIDICLGVLSLIIMSFKGSAGANKYGEPPKY